MQPDFLKCLQAELMHARQTVSANLEKAWRTLASILKALPKEVISCMLSQPSSIQLAHTLTLSSLSMKIACQTALGDLTGSDSDLKFASYRPIHSLEILTLRSVGQDAMQLVSPQKCLAYFLPP